MSNTVLASPSEWLESHIYNENPQALARALEEDGFVFFRDFFPEALVDRAKEEIESLYREDLAERARQEVDAPHFKAERWNSILTKPSHLMLDIYGKSPAFDAMTEHFLTHPVSAKVLQALAGENIKFRGYNVRRMTGAYDPSPVPGDPSSIPHEWHTDSPGEFCIAFLLTDVPGSDNSATALLPGSHTLPYCPRWNCLFSLNGTYTGSSLAIRYNLFNKQLGKKMFRKATGAYGKRGDAYIFINDIWHGRQPNLHAQQAMISMIGAFPTDFPYPDAVPPPSDAVLASLPPNVRAAAGQTLPANKSPNGILHRLSHKERKPPFLSLLHLAQLERKLAEKYLKNRENRKKRK
jgi:putative 2OG-Fe(II) oxygenase